VKSTTIIQSTTQSIIASTTIAPTARPQSLSPTSTVVTQSTTTHAPPSSPPMVKSPVGKINASLASNEKWDHLNNLPDYDSFTDNRDEYDHEINGTDGKPFTQRELSSSQLALDSSGAPFLSGADHRIQTELYRKEWEKEESTSPSVEAHQLERSVLEASEREEERAKMRARAVQIEEFNLLLHAQDQFLQGQITNHENVLANENRDIYCTVLEIKKFQAIQLASMDPLLTAKSLGLGNCSAVIGEGESLILQECQSVAVEVTTKQTSCGFEPAAYIGNDTYALSPSGFSLIPFLPCIHRNSYATLNSRPHKFINNQWVEQEPVVHLHNLNLIGKFREVFLNMLNFSDHYHTVFDYNPIDQLSILATMIGNIQEFDPKSVDGILTSVKEAGMFDHLYMWVDYLKYFAIGIISFMVLATVIRLIACCNPLPALRKILNSLFTRSRRLPDHIPMTEIRAEPPRSEPVRPYTGPPTEQTPAAATLHLHNDTVFAGGRLLWKHCGCPVGATP